MLKILTLVWLLAITGCVSTNSTIGVRTISTKNGMNMSKSVQNKDFGDYYALLIYVDDYSYLKKLETPKYDVEAMAEILKSRYGFKETEIISNPSNSDELFKSLDRYTKKMKREDNLLIYYAGHGSKDGYWQLKDATKDTRAGWISITSAINDTLTRTIAKHILVISDSCYSGAIFREGETTLPYNRDMRYYKEIYQKKSRKALTSGGLEPVLDGDPLNPNNSIFTNALLYTLKNNKKSVFSLEEKFSDIKKYIKLKADQTPQYSDIAKTGHDMGGDFIFVDNMVSVTQLKTDKPITTSALMPQKTTVVTTREVENSKNRISRYHNDCDLQNGKACARLGLYYKDRNEREEAVFFLKKACSLGVQGACFKYNP